MKPESVGILINEVRLLPSGRKLLDAIDRECGYGKVVFNPECERKNIFNQGKQSLAVWLHQQHEAYIKNVEKNND